jgi:hypothetical protein
MFSCYVFFPYLPTTLYGELILKDAELKTWTDEILLSTLRQTYPPNIISHYPRS